jgi:hypothetical protein
MDQPKLLSLYLFWKWTKQGNVVGVAHFDVGFQNVIFWTDVRDVPALSKLSGELPYSDYISVTLKKEISR